MIPYLLALAGGYLIGSSMKDSYEDGGVMSRGGEVKEIGMAITDEYGIEKGDGISRDEVEYVLLKEKNKLLKFNGRFARDSHSTITQFDEIISELKKDGWVIYDSYNYADGGVMAKGGKIKWQDVNVGDSARVVAENKMGLIFSTYGRKFNLRFPDGKEKTYDATELEFYKDDED